MSVFWLGVFLEPAVEPEAYDSEEGFGEDSSAHFGDSFYSVDEYDGYFFDFESALVGSEFHLYLEGIAFEADGIEVDGFEYASFVAFESGCCVVDFEACDESDVDGGEVGHKYSAYGPVDYVDSRYISAADGKVEAFVGTG